MTPKDNREHSFDSELAEIVGIEKAILLKNFSYWCAENKRRKIEQYFFDGLWWTTESLKSLSEKYKYMKKGNLSRWINELAKDGWIVLSGEAGKTQSYRTGIVYECWRNGEDWSEKLALFQNETPKQVFQNETQDRFKMKHNNIDLDIELEREGEKIETINGKKYKRVSGHDSPLVEVVEPIREVATKEKVFNYETGLDAAEEVYYWTQTEGVLIYERLQMQTGFKGSTKKMLCDFFSNQMAKELEMESIKRLGAIEFFKRKGVLALNKAVEFANQQAEKTKQAAQYQKQTYQKPNTNNSGEKYRPARSYNPRG